MRFTVLGASGLIGSQSVERLAEAGHDVVPATRSTGVDVVSGTGLRGAFSGADVVIDVTNSPTFDASSVDFFQSSANAVAAAAEEAGVRHLVILSIVGVDRVPQLDYYRAKTAQEEIVASGRTPYSIVRATQFYEFVEAIMSWTTDGDVVRLPRTPLQPIAASDVSAALVGTAAGTPLQGVRGIGGPEVFPLDELGRIALAARPDGRSVVTDDRAGPFALVAGDVLVAPEGSDLGPTYYGDWLERR
ncbi:SDR family oxidoreductase [Streptomyces tirandamycinicus]|uniref:LysR family transcriptional regulator n=1 Tax=Streptomyces tirandamycinicus TaxID=2174846 RepID=A0A2S1T0U8_9ACTN|nr:SDR family oxidoreductase [Streptomyces tirandamycinicus]AWI32285.1 LysR family transcriptional regulator [Streptomyces tirandamycinicus]